jgi:hypothetical protein
MNEEHELVRVDDLDDRIRGPAAALSDHPGLNGEILIPRHLADLLAWEAEREDRWLEDHEQ